MKTLLLTLMVLASLKITTYGQLTMKQAREQEEREREEQREREQGISIATSLCGGQSDESPSKPLNLPLNNLNQLDEARRRYWAAYEKGDPVELLAAKTVFSGLLFMRDLVALWTDPTVQDKPLNRVMAMTLNVVVPPGDGIPTSAQEYFANWSLAFHGDIRPPDAGEATNIRSIIDSFNRHFPEYAPYKIARDWAEDIKAPVPLPIEKFVFDLVQRWPLPAPFEQAEKDYGVLLNIFGQDRVFAVAKKVRSAMDVMDQDGAVKDPAALGIDTSLATEDSEKVKLWKARIKNCEAAIRTGRATKAELEMDKSMLESAISEQNWGHTGYFVHNCYEVFWTLLTKDDPKLVALREIYRARLSKLGAGLGAFTYRTGMLSLQSIVDEWTGKVPPQSAATPVPQSAATPKPKLSSIPPPGSWLEYADQAFDIAEGYGKCVVIYFAGAGQTPDFQGSGRNPDCVKMDKVLFSDSEIRDNISWGQKWWTYPRNKDSRLPLYKFAKKLIFLKDCPGLVDTGDGVEGYKITTYPTFLIVKPKADATSHIQEVVSRHEGYMDKAQFLQWLETNAPAPGPSRWGEEPEPTPPLHPNWWYEKGEGDAVADICRTAGMEGKKILLYFVNGDPDCTRMDAVLSKPSFSDFADQNLCLVRLSPQPEQHNSTTLQITSYPTFMLLNVKLNPVPPPQKNVSVLPGYHLEVLGCFTGYKDEALLLKWLEAPIAEAPTPTTFGAPSPTPILSTPTAPTAYGGPLQTVEKSPPEATPTPLSKSDWDERLQSVTQRYETLWNRLPKSTRDAIQDDEQEFQTRIQKCSPDQKIPILVSRIRYLLTLQH